MPTIYNIVYMGKLFLSLKKTNFGNLTWGLPEFFLKYSECINGNLEMYENEEFLIREGVIMAIFNYNIIGIILYQSCTVVLK